MMKRQRSLDKIRWKNKPKSLNFFRYTYKNRYSIAWTIIVATFFSFVLPTVTDKEGDITLQNVVNDHCDALFCDNFSDLSQWPSNNKFIAIESRPFIVQAPFNDYLTGWIMHRAGSISPPFQALFKFTPRGDQSNVVLEYGGVEIIIGDAGYDRIAVKYGGKYIAPSGYTVKHYRLEESIKPRTEISLDATFQSVPNSYKLLLNLKISYVDMNGNEKHSLPLPDFIIEMPLSILDLQAPVGVGLIGAKQGVTIEAEFKSLIVRAK